MTRIVSVLGTALITLWLVARLLALGPLETAAEALVTWLAGITAVSAVIAAMTVLVCGIVLGRTSPAWLRFVGQARSVAAVIGCALVIVGLLRYRDTEPNAEIQWLVVGVAVLAGAGLVHGWLAITARRNLS